jgi:predicted nucleic acid-binding protein
LRTLLLDASVWLAAADGADAHHRASRKLLESVADKGYALAALDLTLYEVASIAVLRWGSPVEAERIVEFVASSCATTLERADPELLSAAGRIADEFRITVYDAAYVAAARRRGWRLISVDVADLVSKGLAELPSATFGVTLAP